VRLFSQDAKREALKRAPLFEGLSGKELTELVKLTDDVDAAPGTVLCQEGRAGREFFVIMEGQVEVTQRGKRIATLGSGDFVGEIALLEDVPRTATVMARTPLRFFVMTRRSFQKLLDANPRVERKVLRALARRLVATSGDDSL
jgi:CRP/FNR family transcriptional regulator, cyclic AMP receptor protein